MAGAGALSAHAGPVRVLLRHAALAGLRLVRHGLRLGRGGSRHPQAALHPGGHAGLADVAGLGSHLLQPRHPCPGGPALAAAAPPGVCGGRARGPAFLLDAGGQERLQRGRGVRGHPGHAAGLARLATLARASGQGRFQPHLIGGRFALADHRGLGAVDQHLGRAAARVVVAGHAHAVGASG